MTKLFKYCSPLNHSGSAKNSRRNCEINSKFTTSGRYDAPYLKCCQWDMKTREGRDQTTMQYIKGLQSERTWDLCQVKQKDGDLPDSLDQDRAKNKSEYLIYQLARQSGVGPKHVWSQFTLLRCEKFADYSSCYPDSCITVMEIKPSCLPSHACGSVASVIPELECFIWRDTKKETEDFLSGKDVCTPLSDWLG